MNHQNVQPYLDATSNIESQLREMISSKADGSKLPTVREMTELFRAGAQTVSSALQTLEDEHLIVRRRGSGIYVYRADMPVKRQGRAMITLALEDLHGDFYSHLADGFFSAAASLPVSANFCHVGALTPDWIEGSNVHALAIGLAPYPTDMPSLEKAVAYCRERQIPVISLHDEDEHLTRSRIVMDNTAAGEAIAAHIMEAPGPLCYLGNLNSRVDLARLNGLQAAMRRSGRSDLRIEVLLVETLGADLDPVFDRVFADRPGAIFVAYPQLYPALCMYMLRHGYHDLQLAVFAESANDVRTDLWPTAIAEKPTRAFGAAAAKLLSDLISGVRDPRQPQRIDLQCTIHALSPGGLRA